MGRSRESANIISNGQQATAWCVFDGTLIGTNAPTDGYNVASVTRFGTGVYDIVFTTNMDNINYSIVGTAQRIAAAADNSIFVTVGRNTVPAVNTIRVISYNTNNVAIDSQRMWIQIFGGKA